MRRQDFAYDLPEELIAYTPAPERTGSRLLCLDGATGECEHRQFPAILDQLQPGDVMVFNNTKVIPARVFAQKPTGGNVEILVERIVDERQCLAHVRASKSPKSGSVVILNNGLEVTVTGRQDTLFELVFPEPIIDVLNTVGHIPLPPI